MNDTAPIEVQYDLSLADYRAMTAQLCPPRRLTGGPARWAFRAAIVVIALIAGFFGRNGVIFLAGMFVACVALAVYFRTVQARSQTLFAPKPDGYVLTHYALTLSDAGIAVVTQHWSGVSRWSGVIAADETERHIFLKYDTTAAHVIPKAAFASAAEAARFLAYATQRIG